MLILILIVVYKANEKCGTLVYSPEYKNEDLNYDKTAYTRLNENLWSAHGSVTQKYYPRGNGKSLEFMEVLIGIVSRTGGNKMIQKDSRK